MAKIKNNTMNPIQLTHYMDSVQVQPLATVEVEPCFVENKKLPAGVEWLDRPMPEVIKKDKPVVFNKQVIKPKSEDLKDGN